jgi:hypothetical protein
MNILSFRLICECGHGKILTLASYVLMPLGMSSTDLGVLSSLDFLLDYLFISQTIVTNG